MWCSEYNMKCPYNPQNFEDCKAYCLGEESEGEYDEEQND